MYQRMIFPQPDYLFGCSCQPGDAHVLHEQAASRRHSRLPSTAPCNSTSGSYAASERVARRTGTNHSPPTGGTTTMKNCPRAGLRGQAGGS